MCVSLVKVFRFDCAHSKVTSLSEQEFSLCGIIITNWFLCHVGKITSPDTLEML
jgi:hypothetical protein